MDEIYANADFEKTCTSSTFQIEPRRSETKFHGAVVLSLGLLSGLLLVGLIGLSVLYHYSAADLAALRQNQSLSQQNLAALKLNLNERLQASEDKLSSMTAQRDLLNANLTEKTKELNRLQSLSKQKKTCPAGWTMFRCSCYLLSDKSRSWDEGRADCRRKGADLVVIDGPEEQTFLSTFTKKYAWIGLSDRAQEGTWKWVDGTGLTVNYWDRGQPDNGGGHPQYGEEDCGHLGKEGGAWNDISCTVRLLWICETNL